jgi:hypothetical protein
VVDTKQEIVLHFGRRFIRQDQARNDRPISCSSFFAISAPIESVALAQSDSGTRVVLTIRVEDDDEMAIWTGLKIGSEDLEVVDSIPPAVP